MEDFDEYEIDEMDILFVNQTMDDNEFYLNMDNRHIQNYYKTLKDTEADTALTRAIDAIEFKEPVYVGNWVNFEANIIKVGKSSIIIQVDAFKEDNKEEPVLACKAIFTMVTVKKFKSGLFKKVNHNKIL